MDILIYIMYLPVTHTKMYSNVAIYNVFIQYVHFIKLSSYYFIPTCNVKFLQKLNVKSFLVHERMDNISSHLPCFVPDVSREVPLILTTYCSFHLIMTSDSCQVWLAKGLLLLQLRPRISAFFTAAFDRGRM
jgi:hypothetical protein